MKDKVKFGLGDFVSCRKTTSTYMHNNGVVLGESRLNTPYNVWYNVRVSSGNDVILTSFRASDMIPHRRVIIEKIKPIVDGLMIIC